MVVRHKSATSRRIQDEKDATEDSEDEDRARKDVLRRISLNQWCYQNRSNTLESLIETSQDADTLERDGGVLSPPEFIVAVRCESNDGPVERFEPEFIHHNSGDVYGDVSPLDGRVDIPCFADDGDGTELVHVVDVLQAVAVIQKCGDVVYTAR
jgi:hypothetical protein